MYLWVSVVDPQNRREETLNMHINVSIYIYIYLNYVLKCRGLGEVRTEHFLPPYIISAPFIPRFPSELQKVLKLYRKGPSTLKEPFFGTFLSYFQLILSFYPDNERRLSSSNLCHWICPISSFMWPFSVLQANIRSSLK